MVNIKKLVESELEKAQISLATTDISDTLQKMASQLSRLSIDDIPPVIERIKAEYGIEAGNQFSASITAKLNELTQKILDTKSSIGDEALILSGDAPSGSTMADISGEEDIDSSLDADLDAELGGEEDGIDLDMDIEDDEPALGRKVKESKKFGKKVVAETHEKVPGEDFQSEDGLGAFKISFQHPAGRHTESERMESRKEAEEYARHLKKAGYKNISIEDTAQGGDKPVHESKKNDKKEIRESYPLIVERLLKDCDDNKKKVVESMYKSGKEGRKKVVELAKTVASSKKKKTEKK